MRISRTTSSTTASKVYYQCVGVPPAVINGSTCMVRRTQHSCSLSSLLPPYRNESAVPYAYTPRHWRRPEGEPNRGARWEGPLLRLPQNRDAAEERSRRVWIPQDLWELPPQWSVWTQVHDTTQIDVFITFLVMASAVISLNYIFI